VNPLDFPLLADENIHPAVVKALREQGRDVVHVLGIGMQGAPDAAVLRQAHKSGRVVLTHDRDFGALAIRNQQPFTGVLYVRPGTISPADVLEALDAIAHRKADAQAPFVLVAERRGEVIRIRLRTWPR